MEFKFFNYPPITQSSVMFRLELIYRYRSEIISNFNFFNSRLDLIKHCDNEGLYSSNGIPKEKYCQYQMKYSNSNGTFLNNFVPESLWNS